MRWRGASMSLVRVPLAPPPLPSVVTHGRGQTFFGSGTSALLPCHMAKLSAQNLPQNGIGGGGAVAFITARSLVTLTGRLGRGVSPAGTRVAGRTCLAALRTAGVAMLLDVPDRVRVPGSVTVPARHFMLSKSPVRQHDGVRPIGTCVLVPALGWR